MKTSILICFVVCVTLLCAKSTKAATYDWTGSSSANWSTPGNWTTGGTTATVAPGSSDNVQIGVVAYTGSQPTVNVSSTCATLTIGGLTNVTLTIGNTFTLTVNGALTFASGTNAINATTSSSLTVGSMVVTAGIVNFGTALNIKLNGNSSNGGTINTSATIIPVSGSSSGVTFTNNGTLNCLSGSTLGIGKKSSLINSSTGTVNSTSATFSLTGVGNNCQITNNGTLTSTSSTFSLASANTIIQNTGTFTDNGSTFSLAGGNSSIINSINSGSAGIMHLSGSSIAIDNGVGINNSATLTADLGTTITIASVTAKTSIVNSGTFYAGTSGSACTITLNGTLGTAITNTGTFYLGSTSIINPTGATSSITNTNPGVFTLQSDINGSASIGVLGTGSTCTGSFTVQRYLSGGQSYSRGYRNLSSPVYASTITSGGNNINVCSLNYVQLSALISGAGPLATTGFDHISGPTLYLFRADVATNANSFTGGNYRGINNISLGTSVPPTYSVIIDGPNFNIPVGNGFQFFDRGDRVTNLANKYTQPFAIAESITLAATGSLNTGSITVYPWFNTSSSFLDYTTMPNGLNASVIGFALVGNPYASAIDWDTYQTATAGTGIYAPNVGQFSYVYDPESQHYNTYQSGFQGVGTLGINSNIISSGQGFFVQAIGTSPQLVFNESAKIATTTQATNSHGDLFLGKPVQAAVMQYLNLKLIKDDVNKDGILICFKSGAKPQYDINEDAAYKPGNGILSLCSMSSDSVALAINSLPLPGKTQQIIPLNVNAKTDGTYKLYLAEIKSIPDLYDVWLMDAYQKDSLDLKHNRVYSFVITRSIAATYGSGRFTIVIRQNPSKGVHLLSFTASKVSGGSQIVWKTENEQNYTYFTVERSIDGGATFDVLASVTSSAQGTYSFLDKAPVNGTNKYRLKIEDLNDSISYSQTVSLEYDVLKNSSANNIIVYPNPVGNTINLTINQTNGSTGKPSYGIKVINITGSTVKHGKTSTAAWRENAENLAAGTYIIQVIDNNDNSLVGKATFIKL